MPDAWDRLNDRVKTAAKLAVDRTMADAVVHAKINHPGWRNVTGTAEGSIRIVEFAHEEGTRIKGTWGSAGVHYMVWLELKNGSALRSAADVIYPKLKRYLKEAYAR